LKLFYVDGKLCALSRSANGRPMFEVIQKVKIKYGDGYLLRNSAFNLDEYGLMAADVDGNGFQNSQSTFKPRKLFKTMILKSACLRNVSHKRSQLLNIKSFLHGKNCKNDIHAMLSKL